MSRFNRSLTTFLAGCALFLAIPLITWGLADVPGFFANPARLGYITLVVILNAFAAIRSPEFGKPREKPRAMQFRQHAVFIFLQVSSIAIVAIGPYCDARDILTLAESGLLRFCGLGLYLVGFLLMHFAQMALGRQFSVEVAVQEKHTLITTGLYRIIRHPRYLGIILFTIGISLVFRSAIASIISLATIGILFWRIRDEELFMHQEFGMEWENYVKRSWRLVPYIF